MGALTMPQKTFLDAPPDRPPANPFADARPLTRCSNCGRGKFTDRRIHGGQSTARECDNCGRFMGFPVWYGEETPQ
jgi:hypothetical protein